MAYLSRAQQRIIDERRKPIRHAMDRLIERHMPDVDDDYAEMVIGTMTTLCRMRAEHDMGRTSKVINKESPTSWIIELDMYENVPPIRVCYDPTEDRIRTVLPKA